MGPTPFGNLTHINLHMIELSSEHVVDLQREGISRSRGDRLSPTRRLLALNWLIIIAVGIFITSAMWSPGLLWGDSAWLDLTRVVEFNAAIRSGDLFPVWSPDFYHGYGSPLFQFYSPLVYFLVEVPLLAGVDFASALKLTLTILLIGSGLTMYQFVSANMSRWAATFAAILYMIAPYRMIDLYSRHALAEHAAFIWPPLIVLGTQRFIIKGEPAAALTSVIATACLILTHNITALIALPVCVFTSWWLSGCRTRTQVILRTFYPVFGVGIAAFFWWPAFSARCLVRAKESLTGDYFDFHRHFVGPLQLLGLNQLTTDQMPLRIGWVHLGVAIVALAFVLNRNWRTPWSVVAVLITAGGFFMCEQISRPLWEIAPLLSYVQFPWRFLTLVALGTAMCGAAAIHRIESLKPAIVLPVFLAALLLALGACFSSYTAAEFLAADRSTGLIKPMTSDQTNAIGMSHRLIQFDQLVTPETIRLGDEHGTSKDDFLPADVQEKPTALPANLIVTESGAVRRCQRIAFNKYRVTVNMRESGSVRLEQFWFPGWNAYIDDRNVAVKSCTNSAVVCCEVPAGNHDVKFKYNGLPEHRAGALVSLASIFGLIVTLGFRTTRPSPEAEPKL